MVNSAGLVGKIKEVSDGNAVVMLLTDPEFGVSARALESGEPGSVSPAVGAAGDLRFELVPNAKEVRRGERIITAGTSTSAKVTDLSSLYPAGIPIGIVDRIETGEGELDRVIHVEPVAELRKLDIVEVLTRARRRPEGADAVTMTPQAVGRLALLGLLGGIIQLTTVSQVSVFGVPADLSPLLVASVGFLCGSVAGSVFGFCLGLFVDTVLLQTLGVNSLVFTAVGYGAGRVRELRDPAHTLAPVLVCAAATAIAAVSFSLLQFLLGVEAPVSLELLRQILMTIVLNTLLALPVYAICRRVLLPYLPDDPRRRRRRAYTTGGLSPLSRA